MLVSKCAPNQNYALCLIETLPHFYRVEFFLELKFLDLKVNYLPVFARVASSAGTFRLTLDV